MSDYQTRQFICPECGENQEIVIATNINVTLDPDIKARVLSGELFKFTCKSCEKTMVMVYPFLYHDMEKRIMIWLLSSRDELAALNAMVPPNEHEEGERPYRYRVVSNHEELIDKINIFDSRYDDRIIELVKWKMTKALKDAVPEEEIAGAFYSNGENGEPFLNYVFANGKAARLNVDLEVIRQIIREYGIKIAKLPEDGFQCIDFNWASVIIDS